MCLLFVFFFFKQKTAYEMRISDWSSDVCSSDLTTAATPATVGRWPTPPMLPGNNNDISSIGKRNRYMVRSVKNWLVMKSIYWIGKIGRASCRERVCKYV